MPKTKPPTIDYQRLVLMNRIGQAHLEPGMSLERLRGILREADIGNLDSASDEKLGDIWAAVNGVGRVEELMELKKKAYAISLWQPWASLIVIGAKRYETRGWDTSYRGPLVIHAAKRFTIDERQICLSHPFRDVLAGAGISHTRQLPFGAFLCIVDLVEIYRTEDIRDSLSSQERAFGRYSDNRFAWKLENVRRFPEPIPGRGYQKLWTPVEELETYAEITA